MQRRFQLSFRDRWGEWVVSIILFLLGLTLFLIFNNQQGQAQRIISAVGLSFIGSSSASAIILLLIGSNVAGLKEEIGHLHEEIDKLHENTEQEIKSIHTSIGEMSALITEANSIGLVAIGRSRDSDTFEGGKNLVERWKYFLEHGSEVDLICFRDRLLFSRNVFYPNFLARISRRLREGNLKLRIIITSLDNPFNKEIDEWANKPDYTITSINHIRNVLKNLCGGDFDPNIVKEHRSLVPFTLIRGDSHIFIMYYLPGYSAGPIMEIRPLEAIVSQKNLLERLDDNDKLFDIYKSYFDQMWKEKAKPIS